MTTMMMNMMIFLLSLPSCQEVPLGDAPLDSNSLSHLVKEATGLADK